MPHPFPKLEPNEPQEYRGPSKQMGFLCSRSKAKQSLQDINVKLCCVSQFIELKVVEGPHIFQRIYWKVTLIQSLFPIYVPFISG
ncbi:hypothetical protein LguiB_022727 [Lonicera macranthoides]